LPKHPVAKPDEIAPGEAKLFTVDGRDIAVFNVEGVFYAIANECPHEGGPLCRGRIVPLFDSDAPGEYHLTRSRELLKCPWHGWEFDIKTGQSYCDPRRVRAKAYEIHVESGATLVEGPYQVETFPIEMGEEYLVVET
jgi:nitrite reductase/ring-hydroxylating ferredoxin subunit